VNSKLAKHRDEIEELNNVRSLLKKLQCVFDLPHRLRACVEVGAHAAAVREYAAAAPLLERYGSGAFASVAREVSGTVKALGEELRAALRDPNTRPDDAARAPARECRCAAAHAAPQAEALELLQMLRLPQDELQRDWLSERRHALVEAMRASAAAWNRAGAGADARDWIAALNGVYLAELMQTASSYRELFPESRTALIELCRSSFADYFRLVKDTLAPPASDSERAPVTGSSLMVALARLAADLAGVARHLPELRLNDRAAEVVEVSVRRHVCGVFARVEARTAARLEETRANLAASGDSTETHAALLRLQTQIGGEILEGLLVGLRDVAAMQDERPALLAAWKEVFVDLVQGQSQMLFTGLAATFIAACKLSPMPEAASLMALQHAAPDAPVAPPAAPATLPPPVFMLFLMRLCGFLETQAVPPVAERLATAFPDGMRNFDGPAVQRLQRTAASRLLVGYVQQQGRKLSKLVRRSMASDDWLALPQPRDVRPVCDAILAELAIVEKQVAQLLPADVLPARAGGRAQAGSASPQADGGKIQRNVAKLFQEKLRIFDDVQASRTSVLVGIIKIALKSWVECVRLVTVGRTGYQQLLLDVHYMRSQLRAYTLSESAACDSLMDEVCSAAADRCAADPVGMGEEEIATILASRPPQRVLT